MAVRENGEVNVGVRFTDAQSRAQAQQDEAAVVRTDMAFADGSNTCSGNPDGLSLGCHATGSPVWDTSFLSSDCTSYCHTDTTI